MPGGTLYVFMHGLAVVGERANDLVVVLPDVPGHVHKAGNWLAETAIARGQHLQLHGVKRSGATTFFQKAFTISLPGTSLTSRRRAATVLLPRPKEILGLLLATDAVFVARTKRGSGIQSFPTLATVQVLVYDYDDENEVRIEGHYWQTCPIGKAASLHIVSTSEEPEGQDHEDQTEDILHEVVRDYPGLEYKSDPRPLVAPWVDPQHPSYGQLSGPRLNVKLEAQGEHVVEVGTGRFAFAQAELEHPTSRLVRLGRLARLKRGKQPIESLWRDPDPLSERITNCVTIATKR